MNHLDYNYNQNYYPPGLLAVNAITPNPADQVKFLCSIWNTNGNVWVDIHYQIRPKAMFILISGETADRITPVLMKDIYSAFKPDFRVRVILEFKKKTGEEIEKYSLHHQHMTATEVSMQQQELKNFTLKKLQETKMMLIDEFKMDEPELHDYQKAAIDFVKKHEGTKHISIIPIFQSAFPSPVPLKSNMSKITWNIKDYIPFDTFTILNNLSRDYAYN